MFKKKEKVYPFNVYGLAQAKVDIANEKQSKVSEVISALFLIGFVGFGLMSKEFVAIYLVGKGIDTITDLFI